MNECRDCKHLGAPKYPAPGSAIGYCRVLSSRYGEGMAWAEMGNQFFAIWVTGTFGCNRFEPVEKDGE